RLVSSFLKRVAPFKSSIISRVRRTLWLRRLSKGAPRAVLEHSHLALNPGCQTSFRRLMVFMNGMAVMYVTWRKADAKLVRFLRTPRKVRSNGLPTFCPRVVNF